MEQQPFEDAFPFQKVLIFHCHVSFQPGKFVNSRHQTWLPKNIRLAGMMWKTHIAYIAKSVASLKLAFLNSTRSFNVFVGPSRIWFKGWKHVVRYNFFKWSHCFKLHLLQQRAIKELNGAGMHQSLPNKTAVTGRFSHLINLDTRRWYYIYVHYSISYSNNSYILHYVTILRNVKSKEHKHLKWAQA